MNSKLEGPSVGAFEADTTGVVKQEFVTHSCKERYVA